MASGGGLVLGVLLLLLAGAGSGPSSPQDAGEEMLHGVASWSDDASIDKGACGYGPNVAQNSAFMGLVTAFGLDDGNCGVCYRVICTHPACNTIGVRVTVTDLCRDQSCDKGAKLFEMPGSALDQMAQEGRAQELRKAVVVPVRYEPEDCYYSPGAHVSFPGFRVDPTSTTTNFSVTIFYIQGKAAGNLVKVLFKHSSNPTWHSMTRTHGATWKSTDDNPVTGPISFKVFMPKSGTTTNPNPEVVTAEDVIPAKWEPGATYYPPGP